MAAAIAFDSSGALRRSSSVSSVPSLQAGYGALPLSFIRNDGQLAAEVKYYERGGDHQVMFTKEGVYLALNRRDAGHGVKVGFLGGARDPGIEARNRLPGTVNYLIGRDRSRWRTQVPTFERVHYRGVYPGIDVEFYGNGRELEYDVVVSPGADPKQVGFRYEGAEGLRVRPDGSLEIDLGDGHLLQKKPYLYQEIGGRRVEVQGGFRLLGSGEGSPLAYGFEVGSYDPRYPLVIDPVVLVYSTYLGGSKNDYGHTIAVDGAGHAYIAGETWSWDFPIAGPYKAVGDGYRSDVFVTKLNATGNSLVYSTYLGGSGRDLANGIAVDAAGGVFLVGTTESDDFPVSGGAFQTTRNNDFKDVFVARLNSTGTALDYATYIGGGQDDFAGGIAIDGADNAYIAGETWSEDFPTVNPIYTSASTGNHHDAFVAKLNASGTALVYSTYLGGGNRDRAAAIALDASGNVYVTGTTESSNFPVTSAHVQSGPLGNSVGFASAFVTKINTAGSALIYSTYLGGSNDDYGCGIAVDAAGSAYVVGTTRSEDFPTVNPLYTAATTGNNYNIFVTKLNPSGTAMVYSTYLGGSNRDTAGGIAVDVGGNVTVVGTTRSLDYPQVQAAQPQLGGDEDGFVTRIDSAGASLLYSTYLGGTNDDGISAVALDSAGDAYIVGETRSTDFPILSPFQATVQPGYSHAFVAKLQ
jgi:hypothetical protein